MYKKLKYAVFLILFILIFVVIMDASNRYINIINNKNESKLMSQTATRYNPSVIDTQTDSNQNRQTQVINNEEDAKFLLDAQLKRIKKSYNAQNNKQNADNQDDEDNEKYKVKNSLLTNNSNEKDYEKEDETLITKCKLPDEYSILESFTFENNTYALVSYDETETKNTYSDYVNRKFFIYKNIENKYYKNNYLFEQNINTKAKNQPSFTIVKDKYEVVIKYMSNPTIIRRINSEQLKNGYKQYGNYSMIECIDTDKDTTKETAENNKE